MALKKLTIIIFIFCQEIRKADNLETIKKVEELYIEGVRIFYWASI